MSTPHSPPHRGASGVPPPNVRVHGTRDHPVKKPIPFGNYLLLERVNVGGMAEVFKAKAFGVEGFERLVAVKRILPSIAEDQEFITMFIDEAKIAVQLTHANIAQIFDLGKVGDSFFIAMEYCAGKDLRGIFDVARKEGGEPIPIPMACYSIMKVCEGLDYAHNKKDAGGQHLNLIHRDVSPQNLLVSWDGEIKVIDFGIAKAANKAGQTQAGILKGKFGYMSPEQVRGMTIDRRSDVFAVGIVLYELLCARRLFYGESDFDTLEMVRNVDILPPTTYNRNIPEELERIVLKALAKNRDERYQTAMDLHDDLQSFMYTSGNFFARKDLSAYMRRVFSESIAKEAARDEQYRKIKAPGAASSPQAPPSPSRPAPPPKHVPQPPPPPGSPGAGPPAPPGPPPGPPRVPKATLLGMGGPQLRGVSVPPPLPPAPTSPPPLDMDWDDDGEATAVFDKIEGVDGPSIASAPGMMPGSSSGGLAAPIVNTGAPSPFDGPPATSPRPAADATAKLDTVDSAQAATLTGGAAPKEDRKSAAPLVIGLVATLLGLAVAAWFLLKPNPGTIRLATEPGDVEVYLDGARVPASSSPFVLTAIEPEVTHILEVRKEGHRSWTQPIVVQSGQTFEVPTVRLAPEGGAAQADAGGFTLATEPTGASVFVDGQRQEGVTPISVTGLTAGAHRVRVERDGRGTWEGQIVIVAGQTVAMPSVELPRAEVRVSFRSTPTGAAVTLVSDGRERRIGQTPLEDIDVDLRRCPCQVRMSQAGFAPWEESLEVPAGEESHTVEATLRRARPTGSGGSAGRRTPSGGDTTPTEMVETTEMRPAATGPGTLRINTRPWSQVFVDGRLIGNTPQMNISLPAGSHRVTLVNPDFNIRRSISVQIQAGQTTTRVLTLERPQ